MATTLTMPAWGLVQLAWAFLSAVLCAVLIRLACTIMVREVAAGPAFVPCLLCGLVLAGWNFARSIGLQLVEPGPLPPAALWGVRGGLELVAFGLLWLTLSKIARVRPPDRAALTALLVVLLILALNAALSLTLRAVLAGS